MLGVAWYGYGYLESAKEEEEDGTKVTHSVKQQLLTAERALQRGQYKKAEKACHTALAKLMTSDHSEKKAYLEARAITMDKVNVPYNNKNTSDLHTNSYGYGYWTRLGECICHTFLHSCCYCV